MSIGERLRTLRQGKYSQEQLAEILNVHSITVSKWETDKWHPRGENLVRLAQVLGTTPEYLQGETDNPAPTAQINQKEAEYPLNLNMDLNNMLHFKSETFELIVPNDEKNCQLFWNAVNRIFAGGVPQPKGDIDASMNILDGGQGNYHGQVITTK